MDILIFTLALLLCGLGTWALAKRRHTKKHQTDNGLITWVLRILALCAWLTSLYLMQLILPGLQASFAWLGTLALAATLTVFALPWLLKEMR